MERLRALYTNSPTTAEEPSYVEPELLVPSGDGLPGQDQQHRPDRPDNIYETIGEERRRSPAEDCLLLKAKTNSVLQRFPDYSAIVVF